MRSAIVLIVDIICITVLGIVLAYHRPAVPEAFYAVFGLLGTVAGAAGRTVVPYALYRAKGGDKWKNSSR